MQRTVCSHSTRKPARLLALLGLAATAWLATLCAPSAALAQSGGGLSGIGEDDTSTQAGAQPMTWRPVVWTFYVKPYQSGGEVAGAGAGKEGVNATPTDLGQWLALEPQIRIRRGGPDAREAIDKRRDEIRQQINMTREKWDAERNAGEREKLDQQIRDLEQKLRGLEAQQEAGKAYTAGEPVICGWRRKINAETQATEIELAAEGIGEVTEKEAGTNKGLIGKPHPIQQIYYQAPGLIVFEPDILMSEGDPQKKDEVLRQHFHILKLQITAYPLPNSGDRKEPTAELTSPERIRDYAMEKGIDNATEPVNFASYERSEGRVALWEDASFMGRRTFEHRVRVPGVWEYRFSATVMGRFNRDEEYETKEVEGAIRVAYIADREMTFDILEKSSERK